MVKERMRLANELWQQGVKVSKFNIDFRYDVLNFFYFKQTTTPSHGIARVTFIIIIIIIIIIIKHVLGGYPFSCNWFSRCPPFKYKIQ